MRTRIIGIAAAAGALLGVSASGCTIHTTSDADTFREPIPQASDVLIAVPGSSASTSTESARVHFDATPSSGSSAASPGGTAQYYLFTRHITDSVDYVTLATLGAVWFIVQLPPTSITGNEATWGPGSGDALSPITWKLTVTESQPDVFDYELDGRPKTSTSDADWRAVLTGHGYAKASAQHDTGWFQWSADAYDSLDPSSAGTGGTTKVTYDLQATPSLIQVAYDPAGTASYAIDVTHEAGGAGQVDVVGQGNVDSNPSNQIESVDVHSRWDTSGAGRADADVSGGDVPASVGSVHVTECWDASFDRVYYDDTVSYEPTAGSASACVFQQVIVPLVQ